jgi:hypothetical protein
MASVELSNIGLDSTSPGAGLFVNSPKLECVHTVEPEILNIFCLCLTTSATNASQQYPEAPCHILFYYLAKFTDRY